MTGKCVGHPDIEHANAIYQDAILKLNQLAEMEYESEYARAMALKYYLDFVNVMDTAKNDGIKLGIEIGVELGIQISIELGEQQKALAIAKNLLAKGFDIETIVKITGLDKEMILMLGKSA